VGRQNFLAFDAAVAAPQRWDDARGDPRSAGRRTGHREPADADGPPSPTHS
jgi:hypothetical protein